MQKKKYVHPEKQLLEESHQAAKGRPWSTVAPLPMQLENGSERWARIANDPTHPWLRSSRANKGPLPEWERQRTNNLTARRSGLWVWQVKGLGVAGQGLWVWQVDGLGVAGRWFGCGRSKVLAWQVKGLGVAGRWFGCGRSRVWVWQVKGLGVAGQGFGCGRSRVWDESHAIAAFKQQLGIHLSEEQEFGWIAEVGIQSPLPPRWTAHSDNSSGFVYYVDHDRQVSSWENPLVPFLRRIVELGRNYLKCYSAGYFEEQKGTLWHQHKQELDKWHGPFMDDAGRQYFVNSEDGISSWQDPRIDAQYIFELESGLLTSLEEILPPAKPDTPHFDPNSNVSNEIGGRQWKTSDGAEVITLDHADANQIMNTAAKRNYRERKSKTLTSTAQKNAKAEYKSTMERMSSVAERLRSLQLDEEESQRLQLMRLSKERRKRRSGATPATAPALIRIPSGAGSSQEELRKKPPELDDATPQPPLKRQDTVPPPPPPVEVMQEALAPQTVPVSSASVLDSFAPPAHPPSPTSGKRPALHGSLEKALSLKSDEGFQGSTFAAFELRAKPDTRIGASG
ncbi:unnamed protein product [Cladocopium goreaui]|uniref:Protein-lysine methyltransferase METTL21B n=1 Tax=Cladocopium goreaui TaxID=2562237 RepID=A0A9P1FQB4_9DINO|nr:unnamed protein product [Cladocopium goreaui]